MRQFYLPPQVHKFATFAEFVKEFNVGEGDLLFTNEFLYEPYMKALDLKCDVYFQEKYGPTEPTDIMYNSILADIPEGKYKRIVAVGGGSVVDMAKIVACKRPENITDFYLGGKFPEKATELIIIPTTAGTGSEVTNIAMCYLTETQTKKGCANDQLFADHAVLVPEFLKTLPVKPFLYSAIDALIHAVESYVGRRATSFSKMFGYDAIKLLMKGFMTMTEKGLDARFECLDDFAVGSCYAGIAFLNGGCNLVHAMSFPLGGMFHVAHGESNYEIFTAAMKYYNKMNPTGSITEINKVLADIMGCEADGDVVYDKLEEALSSLIKVKPLKEYGVTEEICRQMADTCWEQQQRLLTNTYVEVNADIIYDLYMQLLN